MSDLDKKFLIHIVLSGEILGPFSQKELIQQIKRGEISGSDEVTGPFSFWRRLQDHPEFRETALNFKTRFNRIVTQISDRFSISKTPATSSGMRNTKTVTDTINAKTMTDSKTSLPSPTKTENTKGEHQAAATAPSSTEAKSSKKPEKEQRKQEAKSNKSLQKLEVKKTAEISGSKNTGGKEEVEEAQIRKKEQTEIKTGKKSAKVLEKPLKTHPGDGEENTKPSTSMSQKESPSPLAHSEVANSGDSRKKHSPSSSSDQQQQASWMIWKDLDKMKEIGGSILRISVVMGLVLLVFWYINNFL